MESQSNVWCYFKRIKGKDDLAQCSVCPKQLSCKGSSTSGLARHLEKIHNIRVSKQAIRTRSAEITIGERAEPSTSSGLQPQPKKFKTGQQPEESGSMLKYLLKPSLSETVARLVAKDGITVRAVTRSTFIREAFSLKHLKLPKNESDVMKLVTNFYEEKKRETISVLKELSSSKTRFSVTLDEWTSLRNRRYFNINVHTAGSDVFNLGLVFIPGKCGATEVKGFVENRLAEFGLKFERDVVAATTDGPNVMKKFGRESPAEMLLCMNHAIHLAIVDVLYKKCGTEDYEEVASTSESDEPDVSDDDHGNETVDESDITGPSVNRFVIRPDYKRVLDETRHVIKIFRKSPLKNGILQEYAKKEHGIELALCLDVKTRWNSLTTMIERFLKLKNSVKKSLIDLNLARQWKEENVPVLNDLVDVLSPIKIAVEALSRKDATILTCDAIVNVLLSKLNELQSPTSRELFDALKTRIQERRDPHLYTLMKYLQNPGTFTQQSGYFPVAISTTSLHNYAEKLLRRLFPCSQTRSDADSELTELSSRPVSSASVSFEAQLSEAIANVQTQRAKRPVSSTLIKKEFQLFETTGERTTNLELLYTALSSVKPTSTESERVFSIAGNFATKVRNRLSDKALNSLTFLKAYFSDK